MTSAITWWTWLKQKIDPNICDWTKSHSEHSNWAHNIGETEKWTTEVLTDIVWARARLPDISINWANGTRTRIIWILNWIDRIRRASLVAKYFRIKLWWWRFRFHLNSIASHVCHRIGSIETRNECAACARENIKAQQWNSAQFRLGAPKK